jgi:hypothetical protein
MRNRRHADAHEGLERDLRAERGAALRRIAGRLEELIERLHAMRRPLARICGPGREQQLGRYRALREQAQRQRWYLEVQREALGLRQHDILDELYPLPGPPDG